MPAQNTDVRTPTPSVYRREGKRGTVYRVVYRPEGNRRVAKTFPTYEEACAFKATLPAGRRPHVERYIRIKGPHRYLLKDHCAYCGGQADTLDHIVPLAAGGEDDWSNFTPACRRCNSAKRDRDLLSYLLFRLGWDESDLDLFTLLRRYRMF